MTPVYSYLVLQGWHGVSSQLVVTVGQTPKRYRIMAIERTRLAGRDRWLHPGETALVPKTAVRHGEHSKPYVSGQLRVEQEDSFAASAAPAVFKETP